jgi:hypothetical protein
MLDLNSQIRRFQSRKPTGCVKSRAPGAATGALLSASPIDDLYEWLWVARLALPDFGNVLNSTKAFGSSKFRSRHQSKIDEFVSSFAGVTMLPRHKKALSEMKSAEKKLKDARMKYIKTKEAAAKALKGVKDAKARLAAAQQLWES